MFRDTQEELQRLEDALLELEPEEVTEEADGELEDDELEALFDNTAPAKGPVIYQNFSNDYGRGLRNYASGYTAYNTDTCDEDLKSYSQQARQDRQSNSGLAVLACLLGLGIIGVLLFWIIRYGGLL